MSAADVFNLQSGNLVESFDEVEDAVRFAEAAVRNEPGSHLGVIVTSEHGEIIESREFESVPTDRVPCDSRDAARAAERV
jgi:hypothetical protein